MSAVGLEAQVLATLADVAVPQSAEELSRLLGPPFTKDDVLGVMPKLIADKRVTRDKGGFSYVPQIKFGPGEPLDFLPPGKGTIASSLSKRAKGILYAMARTPSQSLHNQVTDLLIDLAESDL